MKKSSPPKFWADDGQVGSGHLGEEEPAAWALQEVDLSSSQGLDGHESLWVSQEFDTLSLYRRCTNVGEGLENGTQHVYQCRSCVPEARLPNL